jgi:beta-lactamase regulating signal transducer with metallopeptidase domain
MAAVLEIGLMNAALAAVLAVPVWLVTRFLRHPMLVHMLWIVVLLKLITPPMATFPWRFTNRMPIVFTPTEPVANDDETPSAPTGQFAIPIAEAALDIEPQKTVIATEPIVPDRREGISWPLPVAAAWLAGSAVFLVVSATRLAQFHRALADTRPAPDEIQQLASKLAARFGVSSRFRLRVTEGRVSPLVWPIGRPTILMPRVLLSELPRDELQTLMAHELAHVRRKDHWLRWLELVVTTLFWWHPVVWWARASLQRAEEEACDAWVVSALPGLAPLYASALFKAVQFASESCPTAPAVASALGSSGNIVERIENIMNAKWTTRISLPARLFVVVTALTILPLSVQAVRGDEDRPSQLPQNTTPAGQQSSTDEPIMQPPAADQPSQPAQSVPNPQQPPRDPYRIQPGDTVHVWVHGTPDDAPINNIYRVEPGGSIALGPLYGRVPVRDYSLETAEHVITEHLSQFLRNPKVQVTRPREDGTDLPAASSVIATSSAPSRAEPMQSDEPLAVESFAPPSADELAALREHVKFLENHFKKIDALFQSGSTGGSADAQALAAYEFAVAQGELAIAEGRRDEAVARFEEAKELAEQALAAVTAAYEANRATHDVLLQAAKNLAQSKRRLIQLRRPAQSTNTRTKSERRDPQGAQLMLSSSDPAALDRMEAVIERSFRELAQSTPAPSSGESIGVLTKMVERAEQEFGRLSGLAQQNVISAAELARAKSDYEISVERLRQAERALKYHRAVLEAAKADYQMLIEASKQAPQSITATQLRRAKLAVELAEAKLEELSE